MASAAPAAVAVATTEALSRLADALAHAIPAECRGLADDLARGRR
jgi:hypothetical protein